MPSTTLLEALYHTPGGKAAVIALVWRPGHPERGERYLAYVCVDASPHSMPCATKAKALAQCQRWRQEITALGYLIYDPFYATGGDCPPCSPSPATNSATTIAATSKR